jgi:RNA polymerase sigma-70 factor (ECF subfamily)
LLGSSHDSDDLVQETMLRAWRARETLEDPTRLRPWLYRIATNACLDELSKRPRRVLASDHAPPVPGDAFPPAPHEDAPWLEPMPDVWLDGVADPQSRYTLLESVALAFVAALQVLSPAQRATLLLRDVVGMSAEETAAVLAQTARAVESTLHRARVAIEEKVARRDPASFAATPADREIVARYMRALAEADLETMLSLIHDDMHTTMPPSPTWLRGRADNVEFYRRMFVRFAGGVVHAEPRGVNGGLGCAFFREGEMRAIESIEVLDGALYRLHHFMQPSLLPLFG